MIKYIAIIIYSITYLFGLILKISTYKSRNNPLPKNVEDIYDLEAYNKYKDYSMDKTKQSIISDTVTFIIMSVLLFTPFLGKLSNLIDNYYTNAIVIISIFIVIDSIVNIIFGYFDTFKIEEKYGFNKSTKKIYFSDKLKEIIIEFILMCGLTCLFILLHQALNDYIIIVFAIILFIIIMIVNFLAPYLVKIFNKFEPLEDGSLKEKLTKLLESHGYTVKSIEVMKASEKSTKSNAYFAGFGKLKTIVLYDTLISSMSEDEIVAVFAHEMGHGLHKDTLKNNFMSFILIAVISVLLWLTVKYTSIYSYFGYQGLSYGFALMLLLNIEAPFIMPIVNIISANLSRRAEYRADAQAVKEGYGNELKSALKILSRTNLANLAPNKLNILLEYTHPTISDRLYAIDKGLEELDK